MTERPYTNDDLRAEAARQIKYALDNVDTDGLLEASAYRLSDGTAWEALDEHEWRTALDEVDSLVEGAADVSEWAVSLGADGLEPDAHTFQLGAQNPGDDDPDEPFVRLHFAFNPAATGEDRDRFVMRLAKVIAANL